jgi:hypothetical protein
LAKFVDNRALGFILAGCEILKDVVFMLFAVFTLFTKQNFSGVIAD